MRHERAWLIPLLASSVVLSVAGIGWGLGRNGETWAGDEIVPGEMLSVATGVRSHQ